MNLTFIKNVFNVFMSNITIIFSGVVNGLLLPKLLGVTDYGFYKIFNLYITYVVFFDFGITNGVYLLYGGYRIIDLPKERFRLFFRVLLIIQILIASIVGIAAILLLEGEYVFIFIMTAIYLLGNNIANYFEKIAIMTGDFGPAIRRNITKSLLTIVITALLYVAIRLDLGIRYYRIYTILFVLLYSFLAFQYAYTYKSLIFGNSCELKDEKDSIIKLACAGITLLLADMAANLILTIDRQFVSLLFDVDTYSVYSFAYSMLRIVILAVSAVSAVIYPSLKRMSLEQMKNSYGYSLALVGMVSFGSLLLYYPLCIFVQWFLPNYSASLPVFRVLFPSITIHSIISIVIINHYKALQKQKIYFNVSLFVLFFSLVSNLIAYLLTKSAIGFSVASVISMAVWYVLSEYYILRKYNIKSIKDMTYLALCTFVFYIVSGVIKDYYGALLTNSILFFAISGLIYREEFNKLGTVLLKKDV